MCHPEAAPFEPKDLAFAGTNHPSLRTLPFIIVTFIMTIRILLFLLITTFTAAQTNPNHQLARDIFKELIEINTTDTPAGNVTTAAEAMARRLRDAGFPEQDVKVLGPTPTKGNLVARIHGRGQGKPILFLAHLDVVQALPQD